MESTEFMTMNFDAPTAVDIYGNIYLSIEQPMASINTTAVHMEVKMDCVRQSASFIFLAYSMMTREYKILAYWKP